MRKFKFFTNFDREEQWLNDMAKQGYRLVKKTTWGYEFKPAPPENANIRVDYRTFKSIQDFNDYLMLFEDSGWTHLAGTKKSGTQYFMKTDEQGSDDIFSDTDSKAARYKKISDVWLSLACCFIPIFAVLISTNAIDATAFLTPKLLYYTPGLWEKSGGEFWSAFLFETPFAFFRGFLWMLIPIMILVYAIFAYKAKKQYEAEQKKRF